eukprot:TRINITY_DN31991_c0_g1_i1.p1 TRINITY_DN31991_c0_g1~~TRINITY_DN31991_c0_g1_i1.p1  ORF type:complete len:162 (-),score=21.19 TRINITY_DN31991_c0_g1_i1:55-540(-)
MTTTDWPLSNAEKRCRALNLYDREVKAADQLLEANEASLRAASREIDRLRAESQKRQIDEVLCIKSCPTPRRRWSRGAKVSDENQAVAQEHDTRRESFREPAYGRWRSASRGILSESSNVRHAQLQRAASCETGGARQRVVPLMSLEDFLKQDVPSFPFAA